MNGGRHAAQGATVLKEWARPWPMPGTSRAAHVFPQPDHYPGRMTADCGAEFWCGDLEWLDDAPARLCPACAGVAAHASP